MLARLLLRRGTTAEWSSANPVLAYGEAGVDTSLDRIKIGNGTDTWSNLPWTNKFSLPELLDVQITTPATNQILKYNSSGKWVNGANKSCTNPSTTSGKLNVFNTEINDIFQFNSLVAGTGITLTSNGYDIEISRNAISISGLSDVNITSITDNQILSYDVDTGKFININNDPYTFNGKLTKTGYTVSLNDDLSQYDNSVSDFVSDAQVSAVYQTKITSTNKLNYNLLTNTPTIPTVNDATLTIQKNSTTIDTFTANSSTDKTIDIIVPTKTSDITNDSNFVVDANYVHTDNNYTTAEKTKLSGIATGAEVNVQSDWNVTSTSSDAFIKNKPNLTVYSLAVDAGNTLQLTMDSTTYVLTALLKNKAGTTLSTQTVDLPLESMVVSGSYDSVNKKIVLTLQSGQTIDIPVADLVAGLQTQLNGNGFVKANGTTISYDNSTYATVSSLATVATSGSYNDLSNKPTIPTNLSQLTGDVNISSPTEGQLLKYDATNNKWINGSGSSSTVAWGDIIGKPTFATVATSGSYNDLSNKLTSSTPLSITNNTLSISQSNTSTNGYLSSTDWNTFNGKQDVITASNPLSITNNTLSISQSNTSTNGYLSSTDWNTFNGKAELQQIVADTTSTTATIASVAENTRYTFSQPLTSLTLTAVANSNLESEISFTTGSTFSFTASSMSGKWVGGNPDFESNTQYIMAFKNGIGVVGTVGV